jgi:hypothetical protein
VDQDPQEQKMDQDNGLKNIKAHLKNVEIVDDHET